MPIAKLGRQMALACGLAAICLASGAAARPTAAEADGRAEADRLATVAAAVTDGDTERAKAAWDAALKAAEQAYGPRSHAAARAMVGLADHQDSPAATIETVTKAMAIEEALPAPDEAIMAEALTVAGMAHQQKYDIPKAQEYLARAYDLNLKLYGPDDPRLARVLTEQGWCMVRNGDTFAAVVPLKRAVEIDRARLKPSNAQRINGEVYYAAALTTNNDAAAADVVLRQIFDDIATLPPISARRADALTSVAYNLIKLGRGEEAGELYAQAIEQYRAMNRLFEMGDAQGGLAFVRLDEDRPEEALPLFMEAVENYRKSGDEVLAAITLASAGTAASRLGRHDEALKLRTQALTALQAMKQQSAVAIALAQYKLADSQAQTGDLKAALETENKAAVMLRKIRAENHVQRLGLEISLGWITALGGDPKAGLATAAPAALRMEAESRKLEVAQVKTTGVKENAEMFGRALRTAELAGDAELGFHLAQVLIETDAGRAAAAAKARAAAGPLAAALKRRQELTAQKIKLDDAYLASSDDAPKAAALKAKVAEVQAGIAESEAALDRDFPNYRALTYPAPVTIKEAQARLDPGEALIVPVSTDDGLFVFALTRQAVAWDRTPIDRRAVAALVRRMRAGIDAGVGVRAAVDASGGAEARRAGFDRQAAFQLHQAIFTPKVRALTDRARVYTLATSDAFSALPFAMLVTAPPRGEDADPAALRATPWLIRKAPIQVAPSIPAMRVEVRRAAGARTAFFGAGAPALNGGGYSAARGTLRGATVDVMAVKGLAALPGADVELHAMARALGAGPSQVLTGAQATETAVKAAPLGDVRVVAFATHGLTAGELPGLLEPALVFTPQAQAGADDDALLTASEAAQLRLNADWVILSACNTAAGEDGRSPGYTGLARAFMLAGGDRVLASHWPVRDDAAARLTVDTVRAASRGAAPAKALQKAMLALIDDRSVADGADPSVWAPFVLIGR